MTTIPSAHTSLEIPLAPEKTFLLRTIYSTVRSAHLVDHVYVYLTSRSFYQIFHACREAGTCEVVYKARYCTQCPPAEPWSYATASGNTIILESTHTMAPHQQPINCDKSLVRLSYETGLFARTSSMFHNLI